MSGTSSGEVSARTRMNGGPASLSSSAAPGEVTISPVARPGEAGSPRVTGSRPSGRLTRWLGGLTRREATRRTARSRESGKLGSSAISTAIRSAAWGLRLPTRTCSSHKLPLSIVNSMSHMSA